MRSPSARARVTSLGDQRPSGGRPPIIGGMESITAAAALSGTRRRAASVSDQLAVLAEPHRLLILRHLRRGDQYSGRLARALDISPSLASHHLMALVESGLVTRRQRGPFACFAANREALTALHAELGRLIGAVVPEEALAAAEPCQT